MKFAHMADCHIGGWREPRLKDIGARAFSKAVGTCIEEEVDFVLISGDLFNTSLPSIDGLKSVVTDLKKLNDNGINVYTIAGSHDFSPSGKTMLDVLEEAGLIINVVKGSVEDGKLKLKFTVDPKTGVKITGMLGKKGMLEKSYYEALDKKNLEDADGKKIFMFHTALTEFKPSELKDMDSSPLSLLPKGFDYYAGGHVHYVFEKDEPNYGLISYPGPLFPNNFRELEKLGRGGFNIVEDWKIRWEPLQIYNTHHIDMDCKNLTPEEVISGLKKEISKNEFIETIVTIRLYGKLASGKPSDVNLKEIFEILYSKGAYFVMRNTNKLTSDDFEEIKVSTRSSSDIEDSIIKEHMGQAKCELIKDNLEMTKKMMQMLDIEREEGEKVYEFEERVKRDIDALLNLSDKV